MEIESIQTHDNQPEENILQIQQNDIGITHQQSIMDSLDPEFRSIIQNILNRTFRINELANYVLGIFSDCIILQHEGCIGLRMLLELEPPPIQTVIDSNCITRFIEFIKENAHPILQKEAAQCLGNIASGTTLQTRSIIDSGAIPHVCKLLVSPFLEIVECAVWIIGNITGDTIVHRDMIINYNVIKPLSDILSNSKDIKFIKISTWTLSNICKGRPLPKYELIQDALLPLCRVLVNESDSRILMDTSWAICHLCEGGEDKIQRVIDTGIIPTIIRLLNQDSCEIKLACSRIFGNMCSGSQDQIQQVINNNALPEFFRLLKDQKHQIRMQSFLNISKIAAGNDFQKSYIVNNQQYIESLFQYMVNEGRLIAREATKVIFNCISYASPEIIQKLVEYNIFKIFSDILKTCTDDQTIALVLESIIYILECGKNNFMQDNQNHFSIQLNTYGALDVIINLQQNTDEGIYKRALSILEEFFSEMIS